MAYSILPPSYVLLQPDISYRVSSLLYIIFFLVMIKLIPEIKHKFLKKVCCFYYQLSIPSIDWLDPYSLL